MADAPLIEGEDYTVAPDGRWIFTALYLTRRGTCCESRCRNCPYGDKKKEGREPNQKKPSLPSKVNNETGINSL